ncbi:hypothetical protein [Pedobacter psychroterrae]|uniref:ParB-like nuclease family protein n=1 Tax=Pedobacter psychroterrae TaxID=2530453 RepID=A0A4R0NKF1_9SPHI|nr:hypothetical protein [Pedobacter psychroterrae]TCD01222.1 hypothetical protein EZ437_10720 [Pedobacter psychroterrae]
MTKPIFDTIPLEQLQLDSANPRLPKSLHGQSEAEILEYMLLDASLIELMLAIGKNDFFPGEQLLVVKIEADSYKVVEGNRRLSALKILNNPDIAKVQKSKIQQVLEETEYRPTEIPCLTFEKEEDIHNYLGYRHITGIKEWKLLEKARYLYNLWKSLYNDQPINSAAKELAKSIGSRKDYVKRVLVGYEVYKVIEDEAFYRIPGLDDTTFYFNYIADSLNKNNIAEFLGVDIRNEKDDYVAEINQNHLKEWVHWLFEKNTENRTRLIGDSESLTSLNRVLGNETARIAFTKGLSLDAADDLTGENDSQFINLINSALQSLENADRIVTKVSATYANIEIQLKEIRAIAVKIGRALQDKEDDDVI